jgi:hypothetical protein
LPEEAQKRQQLKQNPNQSTEQQIAKQKQGGSVIEPKPPFQINEQHLTYQDFEAKLH